VEVEIREVKKKFSPGQAAEDPHTLCTPCGGALSVFRKCGGCQYQHIDYERQLEIKTQQVVDAFERVGGLKSPPVGRIIPSPRFYGYRGKGEYHVQPMAGKPTVIGFLDVSGRRLVDIERCEIMDESINESYAEFRRSVAQADIHPGSQGSSSGPENGETDEARVRRRVKERDFLAPRDGFFQANTSLVETLVDEVIRLSAPSQADRVIECYCGSGFFGISRREVQVLCWRRIEEGAVECARENLKGLSNSVFFCGDVKDILQGDFFRDEPADVIVMDPPRTGCERTFSGRSRPWRRENSFMSPVIPSPRRGTLLFLFKKGMG